LFQSVLYILVFLICVATLAKAHSQTLRQSILLVASFGLYLTWTKWFAAVLFTSAVANFLVGKWLRRTMHWLPLFTGIFLNLALLSAFKYYPELASHTPVAGLQMFAHLALPLGISFWTFQAMSYLFDLYRGEELDPSFSEFALYMAFFPVTISGPICRMPDMLPQFRSAEATSWNDIGQGLRRIAIGMLLIQLAKLLGQGILGGDGIVSGFDRVTQWSGTDVWCLAFGYGLQLFFDFSGYSHIAIGAAKALGFTVPENFQRPLESTSPSIFWTRWHMSLSFWIRDYVFFPLATARRELWWRNLALVVSMVVFGLWHKAGLLFLLWGGYQGVLLVLHRQVQQIERKLNWEPPDKLWKPLSWMATISLISLGWILFRANSLAQANQMLAAVISPKSYVVHFLSSSLYFLVGILATVYAVVLVVAGALERQVNNPDAQSGAVAILARHRWFWIPALYVLAMLVVLMITLTQSGGAAQLMYRGF
jgi:alginate O-acetyltransferase complex protein AlgI